MYVIGEGVPKDYGHAMAWFRKAADRNYPEAQTAIGSLYRDGYGVPKDFKQADAWYRKAAAQGYEDAKTKLAALQKQREREKAARAAQIPPALHFRCAIEVANDVGHSSDKRSSTVDTKYDQCLRSNWKRMVGSSVPFPDNWNSDN